MSADFPTGAPPESIVGDAALLDAFERVGAHLGRLAGESLSLSVSRGESAAEGVPVVDAEGQVVGHVHVQRPPAAIEVADPTDPDSGMSVALDQLLTTLRQGAGSPTTELAALERLDRRILGHTGSSDDTIAALLDAAAARLPKAGLAVATSALEGSNLHIVATRGLRVEDFARPLNAQGGPVGQALYGGSPRAFPAALLGVPAAVASIVTVVPLVVARANGPDDANLVRPTYVLLVTASSEDHLSGADLEYLRRLGVHGAVLLDNARLLGSLRSSEQTYRTLVERAELGMALLDADARLQHINAPLLEMTGAPVPAGTPVLELVTSEDRVAVERHMNARVDVGGEPVDVHIVGVDGPVPTRLLATPIRTGSGALSGWVIIARNRTRELALEEERQQLARRVQQAEKLSAVGKFVAGIAHELNNPLTVVIGYAELLTETSSFPAHHVASLEQVLTHARRCGRIVEDLLKFAHHERTRPEAVQLATVLQDALSTTLTRQGSDVLIDADVPLDLPPLVGSQHALTQVVTNILDNAIDAVRLTRGERRVSIRVTRGDGRQQIIVTDTGPGIPDPARIFDPFYTTKPIGKGTGLGLSICYGIVREHDGDLYAENLPEGGARISVVLPEAKRAEVELPALPGVGEDMDVEPFALETRARLLVVDDEPAILTLTTRSLSQWCDVVTAETVEAAVHILEEESFDAILTDLRLPAGLTGADFHEILSQRWPEMVDSLAFMTGDTIGQASQAFLDRVRRPCLTKPFKISQLKAFVKALVEP